METDLGQKGGTAKREVYPGDVFSGLCRLVKIILGLWMFRSKD